MELLGNQRVNAAITVKWVNVGFQPATSHAAIQEWIAAQVKGFHALLPGTAAAE